MIFRVRHRIIGGHVHIRFFAGAHEGALGKCGDLIMRIDEFSEFQRAAEDPDIPFSARFISFRVDDI